MLISNNPFSINQSFVFFSDQIPTSTTMRRSKIRAASTASSPAASAATIPARENARHPSLISAFEIIQIVCKSEHDVLRKRGGT